MPSNTCSHSRRRVLSQASGHTLAHIAPPICALTCRQTGKIRFENTLQRLRKFVYTETYAADFVAFCLQRSRVGCCRASIAVYGELVRRFHTIDSVILKRLLSTLLTECESSIIDASCLFALPVSISPCLSFAMV